MSKSVRVVIGVFVGVLGVVWILIFTTIYSEYVLSRSKIQIGIIRDKQGELKGFWADPRAVLRGEPMLLEVIERTAPLSPYYKNNILRKAKKEVSNARWGGIILANCSVLLFAVIVRQIMKRRLNGQKKEN